MAIAGEVVALLSRPESELPPALASRPGTQPPAGVPVRVSLLSSILALHQPLVTQRQHAQGCCCDADRRREDESGRLERGNVSTPASPA
jgi:hypothetical protein